MFCNFVQKGLAKNKLMPPMVVYKFKTQNVEIEKKIEMMENVLKRKVEILGENYELDIRISNKEDEFCIMQYLDIDTYNRFLLRMIIGYRRE